MPFVGSYGHDKGEGRDHIRIKEVHKTATKHSRKTHRTRTSDIEKTSHTRRQNVGKVTRHLSSSQFHFTETNKDDVDYQSTNRVCHPGSLAVACNR
ncbi:uncharacterized protein LOC5522037 isoform X8 [Nematostella vectensis]|uniref:uncharacterized protein LOC5522037 isoform X8 n=1 Tax=Nematostella vectensis TaxID=45351 RepID=UPI0020775F67|nr:uncharacterized protein LOC5522037 isoform X8 [Nematostella vectensis]